MLKQTTIINLKRLREAVSQFEILLNSKQELREKEDLQPFFKQNPILIPAMADIVGMSRMDIDECEFEFRLWHDFVCDIGFGDSMRNTYCLVELEDAASDSLFKQTPKNHAKFSNRFENGLSQIIDWFWKIDNQKNNAPEIEHLFASNNPTIKAILIIGRSHFLKSKSEIARLKWRIEKTIVDSKKIKCYTYDELLIYFNSLITRIERDIELDLT